MEHTTLTIKLNPAEEQQFRRYAQDLWMLTEDMRGKPGYFTQRLFDLMMHADSENMKKLESVYPIQAAVLNAWRINGREWLARILNVEAKP